MATRGLRRASSIRSRLALVAAAFVFAVAGALPALAAEPGVKLSLRPVDVPGPFFDLTLRPGQMRTLAVELSNQGEVGIRVRTYAADVYTIINGGFGARLRDEPMSGTTSWLDYPSDVFELPSGEGLERSFTLAVPDDVAPGEYISSIILENDVPIQGTGGVTLNQVVRQAIAVVVNVPGPRQPALVIGAASHKIVAGKSTVAVAVENTGNVRLKPVADLIVRDASGAEVSRAQVPMDSFYARTATLVEVPLAALLQPGAYSVDLALEDAEVGVVAEATALPLEVVEPPPPPAQEHPIVGGLTEVIQQAREGRLPIGVSVVLLAGGLLLGVLIGVLILVLVRRQRARRARA